MSDTCPAISTMLNMSEWFRVSSWYSGRSWVRLPFGEKIIFRVIRLENASSFISLYLVTISLIKLILFNLFCLPRFSAQDEEQSCYQCNGNNEECDLATMHADIERFTVKCARDYSFCLTITLEQDGRKLIEKRCANNNTCVKEERYCDRKKSRTVGARTESCDVWCCRGYMCNNVSGLSPAIQFLIMMLGFTIAAL